MSALVQRVRRKAAALSDYSFILFITVVGLLLGGIDRVTAAASRALLRDRSPWRRHPWDTPQTPADGSPIQFLAKRKSSSVPTVANSAIGPRHFSDAA